MTTAASAKAAATRAGDIVRTHAVALRRHLRTHYRLLGALEDEWLQQVIADLQDVLDAPGGTAPPPDADLAALALRLLDRRVKAWLRERSRDGVLRAAASLSALEGLAPATEHEASGRRLLQVVLAHLAGLEPDDRAWLLAHLGLDGVGGGAAVGAGAQDGDAAAGRRRLARLQRRLSQSLVTAFGPSAAGWVRPGAAG